MGRDELGLHPTRSWPLTLMAGPGILIYAGRHYVKLGTYEMNRANGAGPHGVVRRHKK
jgi:hypothetical protein